MTPAVKAPATLPAAITGRWVVLRPVSRDDFPTFFRWRSNVLDLHIWASSKRLPTYQEFQAEMDRLFSQSITFLVLSKRDGEPAGFVQAYNLNLPEGWCFTLAFTDAKYRRGHGAEAYAGLLDYLFMNFALRKVYADIYEFNIDSMKPLKSGGFIEEGRFGQHVWFKDRYWDVVRLAMYRDAWDRFRDQTHMLVRSTQEEEDLAERLAARARDGAGDGNARAG